MAASLETLDLGISAGSRLLVQGLRLSLPAGSLVALLGRNGVGKTLTLHALAGLHAPATGSVHIGGTEVHRLGSRERARRLGLLLQQQDDPFPTTALETVLMGRHAHLGVWQWETGEDQALASAALASMGLAGMEGRLCATLSGGERRRVGIATLLAQDPGIWLLDEPLNHLDPGHQLLVLETLARLAASGRTVIASLHDPVFAMRYFHSALLLHGDGRWQFGAVGALLDAPTLSALYGVDFAAYRGPHGMVMLPTLQPPAPGHRDATTLTAGGAGR